MVGMYIRRRENGARLVGRGLHPLLPPLLQFLCFLLARSIQMNACTAVERTTRAKCPRPRPDSSARPGTPRARMPTGTSLPSKSPRGEAQAGGPQLHGRGMPRGLHDVPDVSECLSWHRPTRLQAKCALRSSEWGPGKTGARTPW